MASSETCRPGCSPANTPAKAGARPGPAAYLVTVSVLPPGRHAVCRTMCSGKGHAAGRWQGVCRGVVVGAGHAASAPLLQHRRARCAIPYGLPSGRRCFALLQACFRLTAPRCALRALTAAAAAALSCPGTATPSIQGVPPQCDSRCLDWKLEGVTI